MPGTGDMSYQTSQGNGRGNIGIRRIPMNGLNPDAKSGLPGSELRTGAELELAGQKPEVIAQRVRQILQDEFRYFSGPESTQLVDVTIKVIQENGLGPNTDLTLIARKVQSRTMIFNEEATKLLMSALERIQKVLNSPDTSVDNNPSNNFPGFGSTPTSSGSALAA
jgi:hypothetical protein